MKRNWILGWVVVLLAGLSTMAWGQAPSASAPSGTLFLGSTLNPSQFAFGVGLFSPIGDDLAIEPSLALAPHTSGLSIFTADAALAYQFHPDDSFAIPYGLAGVGYARYGGTNNLTGFIGAGARIPIGNRFWLIPEIRGGWHHSSRFTIGISKSF